MCNTLILWFFIELEHPKYKMHFNIGDKILKSTGMYDEICVRPAVLENRLFLNHILTNKNSKFYTMVTLQLAYFWQILPKIALTLRIDKNPNEH